MSTAAHEDQPSRPHDRWLRLIVQLRAHLSPVAACCRFGQREHQQASGSEAPLQLSAGGCWIFHSSRDPPSRPSVGLGSMQHVALSTAGVSHPAGALSGTQPFPELVAAQQLA